MLFLPCAFLQQGVGEEKRGFRWLLSLITFPVSRA